MNSGTVVKVTEFFTFTAPPAGVKENGGLFSFPSFSQIVGSKDLDFKSFTFFFVALSQNCTETALVFAPSVKCEKTLYFFTPLAVLLVLLGSH